MATQSRCFALKRAILMVASVILMLYFIWYGPRFVDDSVDYKGTGKSFSIKQILKIIFFYFILLGAIMVCGLFGAWYHNVTLLKNFTVIQLGFFIAIFSTFSEPIKSPELYLNAALGFITADFAENLEKINQIEKISIDEPMETFV